MRINILCFDKFVPLNLHSLKRRQEYIVVTYNSESS